MLCYTRNLFVELDFGGRDLKIDVYGKRQTSNRTLTSTVRCSNLGQLVLYSALKLKHKLVSCRKPVEFP